jgi:hypothetical protein
MSRLSLAILEATYYNLKANPAKNDSERVQFAASAKAVGALGTA